VPCSSVIGLVLSQACAVAGVLVAISVAIIRRIELEHVTHPAGDPWNNSTWSGVSALTLNRPLATSI
jgi:hypothetical protein